MKDLLKHFIRFIIIINYSFLKHFGARAIAKIQEDFGANCYFNTLIPYNDQTLIKYGVIKKSHFIKIKTNIFK